MQYAATMYNQEAVVELCIEKGATVDKENNNGVTPIMAGARDGFTPIVLMLLDAGADVSQVDEFGRTVRYSTIDNIYAVLKHPAMQWRILFY